jgi:hypothetical protein
LLLAVGVEDPRVVAAVRVVGPLLLPGASAFLPESVLLGTFINVRLEFMILHESTALPIDFAEDEILI